MPAKLLLIGKQFGRLKVVSDSPTRKTIGGFCKRRVRCLCICGEEKIADVSNLRKGHTLSCGCLAKEVVISRSFKHGHASRKNRSPEYSSWASMISRCFDKTASSYPAYGGMGMTVCSRWRDFTAFLSDMGERPPKTSLDRIKCELGYAPDNCRWATATQQSRNRGTNHIYTVLGIVGCMSELCERFGTNKGAVIGRLKLGWDKELAFTKPVRKLTRF